MKKRYVVNVYWEMCGQVTVEAVDAAEAVHLAYTTTPKLPPGEFVSDSFEVGDAELEATQ